MKPSHVIRTTGSAAALANAAVAAVMGAASHRPPPFKKILPNHCRAGDCEADVQFRRGEPNHRSIRVNPTESEWINRA